MFLDFLFKNKKKNSTSNVVEEVPGTVTRTNDEVKKIKNERTAIRKGELGEYKIDIQLSQIDHVIITPYGLFVIETKNYQGTIYGGKDRKAWLINGKFKMMNPLMQNYGHIQALKNFIDGKYHQYFVSMVSFTKRCTFKIEEELRKIHSNQLVIYDVELTEFINRKVAVLKLQYKNPILMEDDIELIYNSLSNSNILDESIRKQHIESIQLKKNNIDKTTDENKCAVCQKAVSDKVKSFCLSNKKFQGKVYCYDHQKTL